MQCTVLKPGHECTFAIKAGCGYGAPDDTCQPIDAKCEGCTNVHEFDGRTFCLTFSEPAVKWQFGICNMASHVKLEEAKEDKKLNPLKASKRAGR